jgi:transcriptional regulator with XRE-family HTH domain
MPQEPEKRDGVIARNLSALIAGTPSPATGKPYTNAQVARGAGLSEAAVAALRGGSRPNPTINTLLALSRFFRVPVERLFSDTATTEARAVSADLADALLDADVRTIVLRSRGLSAQSLAAVQSILSQVRTLEGLDIDAP